MYYEERLIDGVLCWRGTPTGEWTAKTAAQLTAMLMDARNAARISPVIVMNPPVVVAPQPLAIPQYPPPPWTVTC